MPFPSFQILSPRSRRQAPRALRERLECSEGGSTGRRAKWPYRLIKGTTGRPFSSQPGSTERAVYRGFSRKCKQNSGRALQLVPVAFRRSASLDINAVAVSFGAIFL